MYVSPDYLNDEGKNIFINKPKISMDSPYSKDQILKLKNASS